MSVHKKILFCFLISASLFAVVAALAITGVFDYYTAEIPIVIAVFLTLFLILFLCFNLRRDSTGETRASAGIDEEKPIIQEHLPYETPEELQAADEDLGQLEVVSGLGGSGCLFKPFSFSSGNPELLQGDGDHDDGTAIEVFYEQNGIHYINSNAFIHDNVEELDSDFARLVESVVNKD